MKILLWCCMHHLFSLLRSSLIVRFLIEITRHDADLLVVLALWLHQIVATANRSEVATWILALNCTVLFVLGLKVCLFHSITVWEIWGLLQTQTRLLLLIGGLLPLVSLLPDSERHIWIADVDHLVIVPSIDLQGWYLYLWLRYLGPAAVTNELWTFVNIDRSSELMCLNTCWVRANRWLSVLGLRSCQIELWLFSVEIIILWGHSCVSVLLLLLIELRALLMLSLLLLPVHLFYLFLLIN